ncbi:MAG: hypothetical protein LQ339_003054 [Xanthoria mediterranea]|nr:MAG: hypothetical protein LQ339_003054 [Xanthoria mediterranea]
MKEASLTTPDSISKAALPTLQSIFGDEKLAKQVLSTAKRISKKRTSSAMSETSHSPKKAKTVPINPGQELSPADVETSLALPTLSLTSRDGVEADINSTILYTNRAPLVVAFVVQLTKHTMPNQPLSSRLSLAQAVMSMGAKAKALNLGIQSGKTAEEESWGEGQPSVRIMGRKIAVMRRWGYDPQKNEQAPADQGTIKREECGQEFTPTPEATSPCPGPKEDIESQETVKGDPSTPPRSVSPNSQSNQHPPESGAYDPPLWALNPEIISKTPLYSTTPTSKTGLPNGLPIFDPHSARNYMLKSFATSTSSSPPPPSPAKISKSASLAKEREAKENNLARLLHALDLVFASWIDTIGPEELDRRAFGWYSKVRPSVEAGREGWGGKGDVRLADLMKLRR